jgi:hypothetical protein
MHQRSRPGLALIHQLLNSGAANGDQSELGRDKEAVDAHQQGDGRQANRQQESAWLIAGSQQQVGKEYRNSK